MNKLISIFSTCLLASVVCADPVTVPNTFTAGTPAKASEVNANFTALANAVNANAPLMVYDSMGKVLGKYEESGNVLVTTVSKSFLLPNVTPASIPDWSIGQPKIYFLEYNCGGSPYVEYPIDLHERLFLQYATVVSNKAYIPDGSSFINGEGQAVSAIGSPGNGVCFNFDWPYREPISLARALMVQDLSVFVPPFSIR